MGGGELLVEIGEETTGTQLEVEYIHYSRYRPQKTNRSLPQHVLHPRELTAIWNLELSQERKLLQTFKKNRKLLKTKKGKYAHTDRERGK